MRLSGASDLAPVVHDDILDPFGDRQPAGKGLADLVEERRPLVTADGDEWDFPLSRRIACTGRAHHEEIALPLPS